MAGNSSSQVNIEATKGTKRKWLLEEDDALIACMLELYNLGTYNVDMGFKVGYLLELEKLMLKKLPNTDLRGKSHIESRIKTLKKDWRIVYDILYGHNTSGFGWDDNRKIVTTPSSVWDEYLKSHKDLKPFRNKGFPHFEELSIIYAKDRVTGKDALTVEDILEDMEREEYTNQVRRNDGTEVDCTEDSISLNKASTNQKGQENSTKRKKRKIVKDDATTTESIITAVMMLGNDLKEVGKELSRSIGIELQIQQRTQELYGALSEIDDLTEKEREIALCQLPEYPSQMIVFFSLPSHCRLGWVRRFIASH